MSAQTPNPSSVSQKQQQQEQQEPKQQQQEQNQQNQPHQSMRPVVFIPLYIYPFQTAWEPLVRSAIAHPSLTFVTVVNPNNGPGPDPRPDANYVAALHQLGALPNVQLLGYVHVSYCTRNQSDVERDMDVSSSPRAYGNIHNEADETSALTKHICYLGLGGAYLTDEVDGGYTRWPAMWEAQLEMLARANGGGSSSRKNSTKWSKGTAHRQYRPPSLPLSSSSSQ
ncbi:hypothetical protein VdG1_04354 [Verticillium dahliae VDG1]|nr:hypothetical protein VdG1_04354 [Verticillium dahliae VDG1]